MMVRFAGSRTFAGWLFLRKLGSSPTLTGRGLGRERFGLEPMLNDDCALCL